MEKTPDVKYCCDICKWKTNSTLDVIHFGEWMHRGNITVHYYCLLLSTHLKQEGVQDKSGILGFKIRDIRKEIEAARERTCCLCNAKHANIQCNGTCQRYFHMVCGKKANALYQFSDDFRSYCAQCMPLDKWQKDPKMEKICQICNVSMGRYKPTQWIHGPCCGNGYVHRYCMQQYALEAGYYLCCLWCKSKKFREMIPKYGIFVPNRDAKWEKLKGAFAELHRGHKRCDMIICNCPRGREYVTVKWSIILCTYCGSVGAHIPCIPGTRAPLIQQQNFICNVCSKIQDKNRSIISESSDYDDGINTSMYTKKMNTSVNDGNVDGINLNELTFSDDDTVSSVSSSQTVIERHNCDSKKSLNQTHLQGISTKSTAELPQKSTTVCVTSELKQPDNRETLQFIDLCTPEPVCVMPELNHPDQKQPEKTLSDIITEEQNTNDTVFVSPMEVNECDQQKNKEQLNTMISDWHTPNENQTSSCDSNQLDQSSPREAIFANVEHELSLLDAVTPPITTITPEAEKTVSENHIASFQVYKMCNRRVGCLGTVTVNIDLREPRFAGMTLDEIKSTEGLLKLTDVVGSSNDVDTGPDEIWKHIDRIISEYTN